MHAVCVTTCKFSLYTACAIIVIIIFSYRFSRASSRTRTWLDNLQCSGIESRLINCPANFIGNEDCSHFEDVALVCTTTSTTGKKYIWIVHACMCIALLYSPISLCSWLWSDIKGLSTVVNTVHACIVISISHMQDVVNIYLDDITQDADRFNLKHHPNAIGCNLIDPILHNQQ